MQAEDKELDKRKAEVVSRALEKRHAPTVEHPEEVVHHERGDAVTTALGTRRAPELACTIPEMARARAGGSSAQPRGGNAKSGGRTGVQTRRNAQAAGSGVGLAASSKRRRVV